MRHMRLTSADSSMRSNGMAASLLADCTRSVRICRIACCAAAACHAVHTTTPMSELPASSRAPAATYLDRMSITGGDCFERVDPCAHMP